MDSEDETFFDEFDQYVRKGGQYSTRAHSMIKSIRDSIGMRLYQTEEWEILNSRLGYHEWQQVNGFYGDSDDEERVEDVDKIDWSDVSNSSAIHRFQRFLDSIKGFHSGSLDYTGRHEYRYRRLNARWNKFLADLLKISRHATKVPDKGSNGTPMKNEGEPIEYTMDRPELLEKFRRDWRTGALSLSLMFRCTDELLQYLSEYPTPIFQKLMLQDLPPELVYHIVRIAGFDGARRLGSTSRYFREIASPYFYSVRLLDMPFRPDEIASETEEEVKSFIESQVRSARDTLLDELDFIISRPDILKRIIDITMFGRQYGYAKSRLRLETGCPRFMELFSPIQSRIGLLLEKVVNLQVLTLQDVVITQDVIQAIATLQSLTTLSVHTSEMVKVPQLPRCLSVTHVTLEIPFMGDASVLALIGSFPKIHFLHLLGLQKLNAIESAADTHPKANPFSPLKRLILEGFNPLDMLSLAGWIQEAPSLQLTHVWVRWREPLPLLNPDPPQLRLQHTLLTLGMAPLQVLILDCLRYAEPDVLDEVAEVFPNLRALTLFYATSPTSLWESEECWSVWWPNAFHEYAPHFRHFSQLEFFGWNFQVDVVEGGAIFQLFEDGSPQDQAETKDDEPIEDWKFITGVLADHCPTLKYVIFHPATECQIIHTAGGSVVVTEGDPGWVSDWKEKKEFSPFLVNDWNICKRTAQHRTTYTPRFGI